MPKTSPQPELVYKVKVYGSASDKAVFFFCPFGVPSWQFALPGLPIWHLVRNGFQVIAYSYGIAVATRSPRVTIHNVRAMLADSTARISKLDASVQVSCFGTSMGTVLAANMAASHARVKNVILNLSYSDTAEHIINLPPIPAIPRKRLAAYIAAAGGEQALRRIFESTAPLNLVGQLQGKRVLLYLSKTDKVLQPVHTAKLRQALQAGGIELHYYENQRGGHYFAIVYNSLRAQRYLRFLRQAPNTRGIDN